MFSYCEPLKDTNVDSESQVQMADLANKDASVKVGKTNGRRTICCCRINVPKTQRLKDKARSLTHSSCGSDVWAEHSQMPMASR